MEEKGYVKIKANLGNGVIYSSKIPKKISKEIFPEVLKKLRGIIEIMPEIKESEGANERSAVMDLNIEDSKEVLKKYKEMDKDEFSIFLRDNYGTARDRRGIVNLMGKLRKRTSEMEGMKR